MEESISMLACVEADRVLVYRINALALELVDKVVNHPVVEVLAAKMGIATNM